MFFVTELDYKKLEIHVKENDIMNNNKWFKYRSLNIGI